MSDLSVFTTGTIDRVDCLRSTTRHEVHIGLHPSFDSDISQLEALGIHLPLWKNEAHKFPRSYTGLR